MLGRSVLRCILSAALTFGLVTSAAAATNPMVNELARSGANSSRVLVLSAPEAQQMSPQQPYSRSGPALGSGYNLNRLPGSKSYSGENMSGYGGVTSGGPPTPSPSTVLGLVQPRDAASTAPGKAGRWFTPTARADSWAAPSDKYLVTVMVPDPRLVAALGAAALVVWFVLRRRGCQRKYVMRGLLAAVMILIGLYIWTLVWAFAAM